MPADFPTENPYQTSLQGSNDAFVAKLSSIGNSLIYSTYLGGDAPDWAYGISVDSNNNAYVTGRTHSSNFPIKKPFQPLHHGGYYDAYVTKFSAFGDNIVYSSYLGGNDGDDGLPSTVKIHSGPSVDVPLSSLATIFQ